MKKTKSIQKLVAILIVLVMITGILSACVKTDDVIIQIAASGDVLESGKSIVLSVLASNGGTVTLSVDKNDIVEIVNGNSIKIKDTAVVAQDTTVVLTATLDSDPTVQATKTFTVKATISKGDISVIPVSSQIAADGSTAIVVVTSPEKGAAVTIKAVGENANLVQIAETATGAFMTVVGNITMDTDITIEASLVSDPTVKGTAVVTIKGPNAGSWISLSADRYNIDSDHPATLTVTSYNNGKYTINVSQNDNAAYYPKGTQVRVYQDVTEEKTITVYATLNDEPSVKSKEITLTIVPPIVPPTINIKTNGDDIVKAGKDLTLTVEVPVGEDYNITVSDENVVAVTKNGSSATVSVKNGADHDKTITVKATLKSDPKVEATKSILYVAPRVDGTVKGGISTLSTSVFNTFGEQSLTIEGILSDFYEDFNNSRNDSQTDYNIVVKMEDGKWYGAWSAVNVEGGAAIVNEDMYIMSTETATINGVNGHIMKRVYVDKDNNLSYKNIIDYRSIPTLWENQHLWNHFGSDNVENYAWLEEESTAEYDVYQFVADKTTEWALYYLTYLSYAYTPLLSDTLDTLYLKVDKDNNIIGLVATTEMLYQGADTREDASAMSYTRIDLTFKNVGATTVPTPSVYQAPAHADVLQQAIDNMKAATNYTFKAVETSTYAPSGDDSDYTYESVGNDAIQTMSLSYNYTSAVSPMGGKTTGLQGWITNSAILLEKVSQYSYTMDGNDMRVETSGYYAKKIDNVDYYDYFEYDSALKGFKGKQQYLGSIQNVLPGWDFSANVFEFIKADSAGGTTTYEFRLREGAITRDVAMQISMHSYAVDGSDSATRRLTIIVDDKGNVVSTMYPYSITQGTYMGYITTTYSKVGTTEIDEKEFEDYMPREISPLWSAYELKYYHPDHSTQSAYAPGTGETILKIMFDDKWENFPRMTVFTDAFGDRLSGPFFEWREVKDANDKVVGYEDFFSMNADTDEYDENMQISNETYNRIINSLKAGLEKYGFEETYRSPDHDAADRSDRYVSFGNQDLNCQIVVTNNHTKNFFIDVGYFGDWKF